MLFPTPITQNNDQANKSYVSLTRNLAHANIMLDLSRTSIDWQALLPDLIPAKQQGYLLVGWGDQEIYKNTPTWAELKPSIAFNALFINTPAVLHFTYLPNSDSLRGETVTLHMNITTSQAIEQHIFQTFQHSPPQMAALGYGANDRFYYALGKYNVFNTCNTWIGNVLRQSGMSISRWTPFSYNVIHGIPDPLKTSINE